MKLLHLSDLHLTEGGYKIWNTDTMAHFNRAIKIIRTMEHIDAIIVSGDLSNDGSLWTYQYIDETFKSVGIPTYCCPGNHDDIETMLYVYKPLFYSISPKIYIGNWRFLIFNSAMPEMTRGKLDSQTMKYLQSELADNLTPTAIVFHHPAKEPGGWLNQRLLDNRDEFNKMIANCSNIKLILYGHIHYNIQHVINGKIYSAAPSIGYAFDKNLPKFQIADGQEGFNLISISKEEIKIENILIK